MLYIAEQTIDKQIGLEIDIKKEIDEDDVNRFFGIFSFCPSINIVKILKQIVIQNGVDFMNFMKPENLNRFTGSHEYDMLIVTANKLILNYATSLKTFIDIGERHLKEKKGESSVKLFQSIQHRMYDTNMEYRVWMNLRNYVVHCGFPYTKVSATIENGVKLCCIKDHLLQFNNWKHAQRDIMMMENEIALEKLITPMCSMILGLFIEYVTAFKEDIVSAIKMYGEFCRFHGISKPVFCRVSSIDDLKSGNIALSPIPVSEVYEAFEILRSNPRVKINVEV